MATRDICSYFKSKKAEKKDLQVQIPQLVKKSGNVTVAEVSAIKTELKNSRKEEKNIKLTCLQKSKAKLVNIHPDKEHRRQLHNFVENISSTL